MSASPDRVIGMSRLLRRGCRQRNQRRATLHIVTTTTTLPPRTILRLSGPETMKFLHDVCTQDVASLQPGASALAAFLDDKGRVLADARITATEEGAVIDAVAEAEPGLGRAVASVAPLAGVEVESASWHALRVDGSELVAAEFE